MYAESRKIQLIEEVLKVTNESTLIALEDAIKKSKKTKGKKFSIYDFVGILSKKESSQIRKVIRETSETINIDDWK